MNLIIRPVIIIAKIKNKKKTFSKHNVLFIELACYRGPRFEVGNDVSDGGFVSFLWQT